MKKVKVHPAESSDEEEKFKSGFAFLKFNNRKLEEEKLGFLEVTEKEFIENRYKDVSYLIYKDQPWHPLTNTAKSVNFPGYLIIGTKIRRGKERLTPINNKNLVQESTNENVAKETKSPQVPYLVSSSPSKNEGVTPKLPVSSFTTTFEHKKTVNDKPSTARESPLNISEEASNHTTSVIPPVTSKRFKRIRQWCNIS